MAASGRVFRHYLCFAFCDHVAGTWSLTQKNYAPKVGIKYISNVGPSCVSMYSSMQLMFEQEKKR